MLERRVTWIDSNGDNRVFVSLLSSYRVVDWSGSTKESEAEAAGSCGCGALVAALFVGRRSRRTFCAAFAAHSASGGCGCCCWSEKRANDFSASNHGAGRLNSACLAHPTCLSMQQHFMSSAVQPQRVRGGQGGE